MTQRADLVSSSRVSLLFALLVENTGRIGPVILHPPLVSSTDGETAWKSEIPTTVT